MNSWIDRLIDLGLGADAECWLYGRQISYQCTCGSMGGVSAHGYGGCGSGYAAYYGLRRTGLGYGRYDGDGYGSGWSVGYSVAGQSQTLDWRVINQAIYDSLSQPTEAGRLAMDAVNDFTRTRMRGS